MDRIAAMLRDLGPPAPGHPLDRIVKWRVSKDMYDKVKAACVEYRKDKTGLEFRRLAAVEIEVAPLMLPGKAMGFAANGEMLMVIG